MVVTKFGRQKPVIFRAFRQVYLYQSHYFLSCEILFYWFVSLKLALILFEITLTYASMNMIKILFVISYISRIAYLVVNFSFCWTPLSIVLFIVNPCYKILTKKKYLYLSRKASGALFIIMTCMGLQEISMGVSRLVVCLCLWNMFSFLIRELCCWCIK